MREGKNSKYPCTKCPSKVDDDYCLRHGKYKSCQAWQMWFRQQWRAIQKFFGIDVSECHEKKEGDLNE